MLKPLKQACLSVSRSIGVSGVVSRSEWRRRRLLVIGWHGVSRYDEHLCDPELYVSADTLARRLESLRRCGCTVLPLEEAMTRLAEGTLPDGAVALTFDDGYVDYATVAWPMLQAAGLPATVYLTTRRCEHNLPIVRLLLRYALWQQRAATLDGTGLPGLESRTYALASENARQDVIRRVTRGMDPAMGSQEKDAIVRRVIERAGGDYDELVRKRVMTIMSPDEVRALSSSGGDVQLHTHCHYLPTDAAAFARDLARNARVVEDLTGARPRHFCYPSGEHRPWQLPVLREADVISATTCNLGLASSSDDPLLVPRLIDRESMTDVEFESWLTGSAMFLPRRRRTAA